MNIMKFIIPAIALFGFTGCEYSEESLKGGPGYYKCISNIDRLTLIFDTKTFSISRSLSSAMMTFTNLKDRKVYRLHSVEDRDYNCERITKEEALR